MVPSYLKVYPIMKRMGRMLYDRSRRIFIGSRPIQIKGKSFCPETPEIVALTIAKLGVVNPVRSQINQEQKINFRWSVIGENYQVQGNLSEKMGWQRRGARWLQEITSVSGSVGENFVIDLCINEVYILFHAMSRCVIARLQNMPLTPVDVVKTTKERTAASTSTQHR